ncbi:WD40-repeat-containing domain protein [Ilyonectria robusta]|uniref:WD40-repeat-containing domain protein n=1 Tax=Ilyonectria robusta TaxID=1079257 RepID=UPI001E8E82F1|nr:WD40-repeat-containing domain protein [Ilyonectria robusta]KAH8656463.1 WD40-repeat-containing domain protein [Ilyonectria robusta]
MPSMWSAWKSKLKRRSCQTSPPQPALTTSETPSPSASPGPEISPQSLQERLWNQAYDELKANESKTVQAYEKILTCELKGGDPTSMGFATQGNEIEQTQKGRWGQMEQVVRAGLERTAKEADIKQGIQDGMQAVYAVKGIVDKAVQASPEAAIAWVGVCFALEILSNPITEAGINREGIAYVVSRMDWYWSLTGLLLDENRAETPSAGLRDQLETHVAQLYQKLLLYQMKSVCLYYRNRGAVFLRDMLKLDDWDGTLDEIRKAEDAVRRDSEQYSTEQIRSHLQAIAIAAGSQEMKLQAIYLAIQDETKRQCLKDLRVTDARDDKARIVSTKGGLLEDSYRWILDDSDFIRWRDGPQKRLFWIKGDPGKGKTMLICGIIDHLNSKPTRAGQPAYFFCQGTDARLNNAAAVLRSLIYFLIIQNPPLISYVQEQYNHAGKLLFEDANAWVALSRILTKMLDDPMLKGKILIVDALDECVTDLEKLINFIYESSSSCAKWIVSSRNLPTIEETLDRATEKVKLCLELKADSISAAVQTFIQYKVDQLAQLKEYDNETGDEVRSHLLTHANDTFLWVALVCQELEKADAWNVSDILKDLPGGLEEIYDRMMRNIGLLQWRDPEFCQRILSTVSIAYRPLHLEELGALSGLPPNITKIKGSTAKIASMCGSFLTIRDGIVYFVHHSAKEFLLNKASDKFLQSGIAHEHHAIFLRSIEILKKTLWRDVYGLRVPGFPIECVSPPDPDPLAASRYSCIYWADHLCDSNPTNRNSQDEELRDGGTVHSFFKNKYLYWLEALSLLRGMSEGVVAIQKLKTLLGESTQLADLLEDAHRFVLSHKRAIEIAPLQVYASALLFSPTGSVIRRLFGKEEPNWILLKPIMATHWSACLATLEGHRLSTYSVAFTADGQRLASAGGDCTIKIWDPATGACLQTLRGHGDAVRSVAFTADGKRLASAGVDHTIKIWDPATGACVQTLKDNSHGTDSVAFTADGQRLASGSFDGTVKVWDPATGACLQTLRGHDGAVCSVAFTADGKRLASASNDGTVKIWHPASGVCLETLEGLRRGSVAFTADGQRLASASRYCTVKIWDPATGACLQTLRGHGDAVCSVAFTADGKRLASASDDGTIKVWNPVTGACLQTLKDNSGGTYSVAFTADGQRLASGSFDGTVKVWDPATGACLESPEAHSNAVHTMACAADGQRLASGSDDGTVKIWDSATGACLHTLRGDGDYRDYVHTVAFTADSQRLVSAWRFGTVKIWDPITGECLQTWKNRGVDDVVKLRYESAKYSHLFVNVPSTGIQPLQAPFPGPKYDGYSLHPNKPWIMKDRDRVLWLPPEYRPETGALAVFGRTIGIGCVSGRVLIMRFSTRGLDM